MRSNHLFLLAVLLYTSAAMGQNNYHDQGLTRSYLNFVSSVPFNSEPRSIYLCGDFEYYFTDKVSLDMSGYIHLGQTKTEVKTGYTLDFNHSLFVGPSFHLKGLGSIDPFIGLQTGVGVSKLESSREFFGDNVPLQYLGCKTTVNPQAAIQGGINYYAGYLFNLTLNARYVIGKHHDPNFPAYSLNELQLSAGLGFHIWAKKGHFGIKRP